MWSWRWPKSTTSIAGMHFIRSSAAAWKWKVKRVGKMTIINVMLYCKWFELSQRRGKGRNNGVESYVSILRFVFLMRTNWPNKVFHFTHIHYFYFLFILLCSQYFPFSSTTEHKWLLLYKNAAFTLLIALSTFNSTSTHNQLESVMWNLLRIFFLSLAFFKLQWKNDIISSHVVPIYSHLRMIVFASS